MAAHLAGQLGLLLAHLLLDKRVPRGRHDSDPAQLLHTVEEGLGTLDLPDDLGLAWPLPVRDEVGAIDVGQLVAPDDVAVLVDGPDAVNVAIVGDAKIGMLCQHTLAQSLQCVQTGGIGVVIREGAIRLGVHEHGVHAQLLHEVRDNQACTTVSTIDDNPGMRPLLLAQRTLLELVHQLVTIDRELIKARDGAHGYCHRVNDLGEIRKALNLISVERLPADRNLKTVVLRRVMAARDHDSAVHRQGKQGMVQRGRRHDTNVHDIPSLARDPIDQCCRQVLTARTHVAPDRERQRARASLLPYQVNKRLPYTAGCLRCQFLPDLTPDIVHTKHRPIQHHTAPPVPCHQPLL